jgi:hypothetical protein
VVPYIGGNHRTTRGTTGTTRPKTLSEQGSQTPGMISEEGPPPRLAPASVTTGAEHAGARRPGSTSARFQGSDSRLGGKRPSRRVTSSWRRVGCTPTDMARSWQKPSDSTCF